MLRSTLWLLAGAAFAACGALPNPAVADAGLQAVADAGTSTPDAGPVDAGVLDAADAGPPVSYAKDIQPLFDARCVSCHNYGAAIEPYLDSGPGGARQQLLGQTQRACAGADRARYLVAGKPERSHLYYRLTGTSELPQAAECGRLMPLDAHGVSTPLVTTDPAAVERVRRWILQGAQFD